MLYIYFFEHYTHTEATQLAMVTMSCNESNMTQKVMNGQVLLNKKQIWLAELLHC